MRTHQPAGGASLRHGRDVGNRGAGGALGHLSVPYLVSTTPESRVQVSQTLSSQVIGRSTRRVRLVTVALTVAPDGRRT